MNPTSANLAHGSGQALPLAPHTLLLDLRCPWSALLLLLLLLDLRPWPALLLHPLLLALLLLVRICREADGARTRGWVNTWSSIREKRWWHVLWINQYCLEVCRGDTNFGITPMYLSQEEATPAEREGMWEMMSAIEDAFKRAKGRGTEHKVYHKMNLPSNRATMLPMVRYLQKSDGAFQPGT